jgi:hypothetical protein
LPKGIIAGLFIAKLLGGLLYHYILTVRFYGGDSHALFLENMLYINSLKTNPSYFFNHFCFCWTPYNFYENIFSPYNSIFWSDLGSQLNYRMMTISNLLSFGHETVNIIFYNFVFFIGQIALYNCFLKYFSTRKALLILAIFFIPSVWFWCSGIHKDGFVISFVGLTIYYCELFLSTKFKKYLLSAILCFTIAILFRYYIIIALFPAIVFYFICVRNLKYTKRIFFVGSIAFIMLFFTTPYFFKAINPAKIVAIKQQQFLNLRGGGSLITTPILEPNFVGFVKNLPVAINHVMMRPYITEAKDGMYLISGVEIMMLLVILLLHLYYISRKNTGIPFLQFSLFFSIVMLLIVGYIVPFSGAFNRYRSEYFPLLFGVMACITTLPFALKINDKLNTFFNL